MIVQRANLLGEEAAYLLRGARVQLIDGCTKPRSGAGFCVMLAVRVSSIPRTARLEILQDFRDNDTSVLSITVGTGAANV